MHVSLFCAAPKQGSVGALSPGSVASVCRNQQNYLRYLEQTGTSKAGGFDPWAMAERCVGVFEFSGLRLEI